MHKKLELGLTQRPQERDVAEKWNLIFMGRQLLRDPYFPLHAAKELGGDIQWAEEYERAKQTRS